MPHFPHIHLYIVGSGSDKVLADINNPNVTVTGRLESVLPYLGHASVSLVPLRFESGTRFKILEAGACRRAVVSTTLGAEGLMISDSVNILIADEPADFAKAVSKILLDETLALNLGNELFHLVSKHYSLEALEEEGKTILGYIGSL